MQGMLLNGSRQLRMASDQMGGFRSTGLDSSDSRRENEALGWDGSYS